MGKRRRAPYRDDSRAPYACHLRIRSHQRFVACSEAGVMRCAAVEHNNAQGHRDALDEGLCYPLAATSATIFNSRLHRSCIAWFRAGLAGYRRPTGRHQLRAGRSARTVSSVLSSDHATDPDLIHHALSQSKESHLGGVPPFGHSSVLLTQ